MLAAQFFKKFLAAGNVGRGQLALILQEPAQQVTMRFISHLFDLPNIF
jgi:hypothetical protein